MAPPTNTIAKIDVATAIAKNPETAMAFMRTREFFEKRIWREIMRTGETNRKLRKKKITRLLANLKCDKNVRLELAEAMFMTTDATLKQVSRLCRKARFNFSLFKNLSQFSDKHLLELFKPNLPVDIAFTDAFMDFLRSQNDPRYYFATHRCLHVIKGYLIPLLTHFLKFPVPEEILFIPHLSKGSQSDEDDEEVIAHAILIMCFIQRKRVEIFNSLREETEPRMKSYENEAETVANTLNDIRYAGGGWTWGTELDPEINDLVQMENECIPSICIKAQEYLGNHGELFRSRRLRGSQRWFNAARDYIRVTVMPYKSNLDYIRQLYK